MRRAVPDRPPAPAERCSSYAEEKKTEVALDWVEQRYDLAAIIISPSDKGENVFEVGFNLYRPPSHDPYCKFNLTVDDECGVEAEFVSGDGC